MRALRLELVCVAAAAALTGGVIAVTTAPPAADLTPEISPAGVVQIDRGGFRYEYHLPSGSEGLFPLEGTRIGDENVLSAHRAQAAECRQILSARFGVTDISDLRGRYAGTIRRLHALGYM